MGSDNHGANRTGTPTNFGKLLKRGRLAGDIELLVVQQSCQGGHLVGELPWIGLLQLFQVTLLPANAR